MNSNDLNIEKDYDNLNQSDTEERLDLFITETDEIINERNNKLNKLIDAIPDGEKIEKLAKELKEEITTLEEKIEKFLAQHHSDYIVTFNEFIDTVKKDMKLKIEQMENYEKERKKINDLKVMICERDFFRQESIRLNDLNKELSKKNEELHHQLKFHKSENNLITKKWIESEKMLKKISVEFQNNLKSKQEVEKKLKEEESLKNNINHLYLTNKFQFPILDSNNHNNYPSHSNNKLYYKNDDNFDTNINTKYTIERIKIELKKEKMKSQKILTEFNKLIEDQNSLEKLFVDCVEECRKEIYQRKVKESLMKNKINNMKAYQTTNGFYRNGSKDNHTNSDVKLESFYSSDKRKLFEIFILKDEIINLIKNHIFNKKIEKIEEPSELLQNVNKNLITANPFKQNSRASSNSNRAKPIYRAKTANMI